MGTVAGALGERTQVVTTYRYLRLAMVLLALILVVSVVIQSAHAHTVLDSVSAYYYTPAQGVFVGALVGIGVGLVSLRGKTEAEDVALNLAGMLAPVVAFVPTPQGRPRDFTVDRIDNNVAALLVGGAVAVVGAAVLAATQLDDTGRRSRMTRSQTWGLLVAAGVVLAGAAWITGWHDGFVGYAHYTAAIAMFGCIAVAVWVNSRAARRFRRVYGAVLALMVASQLAWLTVPLWSHAVLLVEALLISLFAVFWSVQTWELRYADA